MRRLIRWVVLVSMLVCPLIQADDIDLAAKAMQKAIVTQVKYETLEMARTKEIKELKTQVNSLKIDGIIKDILIVTLAVIKITN